jgi:hypothetical protein
MSKKQLKQETADDLLNETLQETEQRITTLQRYFDGIDHNAMRLKLQEQSAELPWYETDNLIEFGRSNIAQYHGSANDPAEFREWLEVFLLIEARKRAFIHLVIRDHSGVIYKAILRQLERFPDLSTAEDEKDRLFWEIVELAWERGLHEPGSAKLSTRLSRLASQHTRIYTKSLTRQATKSRKLSPLVKRLVGSEPAKVLIIDSPSESEPSEPKALFCSKCGSVQYSHTYADVSGMFGLHCGHFRVNNLHSAIERQLVIEAWKQVTYESLSGKGPELGS